ncbi:MAG: TRAP transporter small permease [Rhodospirillales bacterium]|nr:TRAP transporter small permease [Rhodospirillales bacterium]MDP6642893.1 TRAP transporter small permease [Rhodospirillales bacterium]MDP6842937.1 TRAP transporter small permease [Rhodospirillales bacterium]
MDRLIHGVALVGGFAVVAVSGITVISVIGRYTFSLPVLGDYEIVEYGISFAAFAFLAFTHITDSHLIAEFFSSRMSKRTTRIIDSIQNLILFTILLVLIWRVVIGGFDKFETSDESMFLEMKVWWLHVVGTLGLVMFAWVALRKIFRGSGD